ncbi:hypothetical protein GCM10011571_16290 [Marinithermofilum abyssi]|uniref:Uncharacterized protein n=1 Tax=Marinithermofilum abyssi TaxID=1571185 RepID=A0A8J2VGB7_9BACL|nr:hypothetical protein GCM10011571_16290 [Marinithermofilum abyssi]
MIIQFCRIESGNKLQVTPYLKGCYTEDTSQSSIFAGLAGVRYDPTLDTAAAIYRPAFVASEGF